MSTAESSPPPPTASPTPAEHRKLREEQPDDCCYEALVSPMVNLRSCPRKSHMPCYTTLRVRGATDLRCPAFRATVTVR